MKKITLIIVLLMMSVSLMAQNAWINEFHYDNGGTDQGEFIEVVLENASSYSLSDFTISLYNGNNGGVYDSKTLDQFTEGSTNDGYTFYYYMYPENGIQNGPEDGICIDYQGTAIDGQFISYEGVLTGTDGPATGITSTDIGVYEDSTTEPGNSLQLSGEGTAYSNFIWQWPAVETPGELNNDQSFGTYVPDPEPTNYPTGFSGTAEGFSIILEWTDAVGEQLPHAYLIKASTENDFNLPVDGTPVTDDPDLSDEVAAVNIDYGTETYTFSGLSSSETYYFIIFPYTNAGSDIDYKTDDTPPECDATTSNIQIISFEDFEDETLGIYSAYSVTGMQGWGPASYNDDKYAKMSGFGGEDCVVNEDWLISPAFNFDNYLNEKLQFINSKNYDGDELEVLISNDYDGSSDPNSADWTTLDAILSGGSWLWVESGDIDVSEIDGEEVYIAFKYISTSSECATWQVDDILISGEENVGINTPVLDNFSVFPNPVINEMLIQVDNGNYEVNILSLDGRVLEHVVFSGTEQKIDMSDYPKGIFVVQIIDLSNNHSGIQKVAVQ